MTKLFRMEPVYDTVIAAARLMWLAEGLDFKVSGVEHVPAEGPGVVAINHTGYLDFTYAGIPAFLKGCLLYTSPSPRDRG